MCFDGVSGVVGVVDGIVCLEGRWEDGMDGIGRSSEISMWGLAGVGIAL